MTRRTPAAPYGGALVNLLSPESEHAALMDEASGLGSLQLSVANTTWLRVLITGALSPLNRFMGRADYTSVRKSMRLANGTLFPWPITLQAKDGSAWREGTRIALRDTRNHLLAILAIEEVFERGSESRSFALSGPMQALSIPEPMLFPELHRTPADVRAMLEQMDCARIVAADHWESRDTEQSEAMRRTVEELDAALLLNLPVEEERIDDFDLYTRLRDWKRNFQGQFNRAAILNFLNLPHRQGKTGHDARRLLLHAILHKNYGAHGYMFHAALLESGEVTRESLLEHMAEIGVETMCPENLRSVQGRSSAAKLKERETAGFCIWFTGLPGAGKSTIAERLTVSLMEHGRRVTLLDGDVVRTHLSRGLSFSREDRDTNVQRIGFVAAEIVRHGGVAICAAVSPYRSAREQVRGMMPQGAFVEVFVDTPLSVCEQRDVKGFYAKARRGQMKAFTGVDDPYERPENPEVRVVTCEASPEEEERQILDFLLGAHLRVEA
ncbi:MAG: adenylyl-sulfate kinase [Silvibacterium sp.]